jgi:hypothetical protein
MVAQRLCLCLLPAEKVLCLRQRLCLRQLQRQRRPKKHLLHHDQRPRLPKSKVVFRPELVAQSLWQSLSAFPRMQSN